MALDDLAYRLRPSAAEPAGLLVLMHGRGVDENDLFPLADLFDPKRRLIVVTPRAPLQPPGHTGNHWYVVERVGYPEPESFARSYAMVGEWLGALAAETGIDVSQTVLGGFSQGGVMALALGLGRGRPRPTGILALSCFVPTVAGWEPDFDGREGIPVYLSHGRNDPVIPLELGRRARILLEEGGAELTYRETEAAHSIDPRSLGEIASWLSDRFEGRERPAGA